MGFHYGIRLGIYLPILVMEYPHVTSAEDGDFGGCFMSVGMEYHEETSMELDDGLGGGMMTTTTTTTILVSLGLGLV